MQYTSNLNLKKPDLTDYVEINDLNENMDIIDAEIKNLSEASGNLDELSTDEKNSLVLAVNELLNKIGTLSSLSTTEKSNLVASINEIKTKLTEHLDDNMPHNYINSANGKTYKWGFGEDSGGIYLAREEVI